MAEYDYDLLVIGSGPAGQRAAIQASKLNKRVAVVERKIDHRRRVHQYGHHPQQNVARSGSASFRLSRAWPLRRIVCRQAKHHDGRSAVSHRPRHST